MTEELQLLRRLLDAVEAANEPPTRKVRLMLRSIDAPFEEEDPDAVWCSFGKGKASPPARETAEELPSPPSAGSPEVIATIAGQLARIADHFDPPPPDVVDTVYVAQKLGCTTTWIADLARNGGIPASCLVPGTGDGKPWKFYRAKIETWITEQR
jgi:hypothetical protein